MFSLPYTYTIPVEVHPCSWEGETAQHQRVVVVRRSRTKNYPKGKMEFVLNNADIRNGRIRVRKISQSRTSAVVEPIAAYVPFIWGIVGIPPRQFRVPANSLLPD